MTYYRPKLTKAEENLILLDLLKHLNDPTMNYAQRVGRAQGAVEWLLECRGVARPKGVT